MDPQTAKIEDGKITIALPKSLGRAWKKAEVFLFPSKDTVVIKRVRKPLPRLSELASRVSSKKLSSKEIEKEIQSFREEK